MEVCGAWEAASRAGEVDGESGQWRPGKAAGPGFLGWAGWICEWEYLFIFIFNSLQGYLPSLNLPTLEPVCLQERLQGIVISIIAAALASALFHVASVLNPCTPFLRLVSEHMRLPVWGPCGSAA